MSAPTGRGRGRSSRSRSTGGQNLTPEERRKMMEERQKKLKEAKASGTTSHSQDSKAAAQAKKAELAKKKAELAKKKAEEKAQKPAERKQKKDDGESGGGMGILLIVLIVLVLLIGGGVAVYFLKPDLIGMGGDGASDSTQVENVDTLHNDVSHPEEVAEAEAGNSEENAEPVEETPNESVVEKKEEKKPEPEPVKEEKPNFVNGKITTPCWVISHSSFVNEKYAKKNERILKNNGYDNAGYYWIPDVTQGGNRLYKVYVGPFATENEAQGKLGELRRYSSQAYVLHLE